MKRLVAMVVGLVMAVGAFTAPAALAQAPKDAAKDASKSAKDPAKATIVDINSASADELKALPGMKSMSTTRRIPVFVAEPAR